MSEELNQQLAEAQGFSGVKSLVAEAYQMSLGRTGDQIKKNSEAMTELADAMKKGQVKTDKVFPFLAELLKRQSAPGLEVARNAAVAEESRFWNRMFKGWENFQKGGGETGLALFWKDLQTSIGAWFEENGAWLGGQFESMMKWFKVFRIGLTDFVKFMWSGEHNSFTNWVAQEWNFNLSHLRTFFIDLWTNVKTIFEEIAKAIGLVDKDGGIVAGFGDRVRTFITNLSTVFSELMKMLGSLAESMHHYGKIIEGGWGSIFSSMFNPLSDAYKSRMTAEGSMGKAIGHFTKATGAAVVTQAGLVTGTDLSVEQKPYAVQAPYIPVSPSNMFPGNRLSGGDGKSGAPIRPYAPRVGQALSSEAGGISLDSYSPIKNEKPNWLDKFGIGSSKLTEVDVLPKIPTDFTVPLSPSVGRTVPSGLGGIKAPDWLSTPPVQQAVPVTDWMNGEKPKSATLDVNVKVEVSGDPENMRLFAAEEVAKGIAQQVPKMVDYSFSSKLTGAYTGASNY